MNEILSEGLVMMCIGMGTVLLFLCTLIIAMNVMSVVVGQLNKWFPEAGVNVKPAPVRTTDDSEVAVAIAAAVAKS